jgi:hypothetical protein
MFRLIIILRPSAWRRVLGIVSDGWLHVLFQSHVS